MTPLEWAAGCAYFAGIALTFYAAAWLADFLAPYFPEANDNDD